MIKNTTEQITPTNNAHYSHGSVIPNKTKITVSEWRSHNCLLHSCQCMKEWKANNYKDKAVS